MRLFNHDGSYFDVTSSDVSLPELAREDVMSLTVEEAVREMPHGTLRLKDPNHLYSRVLRPGAKLMVSWGIRSGTDSVRRDPMEVMVNSPSGGGSGSGEVTYDCSFMALGFRGQDSVRWWEGGTKADVVSDAMRRLGASVLEVNFKRGGEAVGPSSKVCQYESDFRFLVRLADEWRCAFRVGFSKSGVVASFVDYDRLKASTFTSLVGGYSSTELHYGSSRANVLSYSWKDQSMDAAQGSGARVVMVDGKPQIFRQVVEDEKVVTYRLVPERIQEELGRHDLTSRADLMAEYLSVKDFSQVKRFFVEDSTTTAPQGSGVTVDVSMMGDPSLTDGMVVSFGDGFPDRVGAGDPARGDSRTWWSRRVSHSLAPSGYFCKMEVCDAYAMSPTGVKL